MKTKKNDKILFDLEAGYDQIAEKFSQTRNFFWRDFEFLERYVFEKDYVLDFGCGNGRLAKFLESKNIKYFGVDVSQKLINIAQKRYPREKFSKINRQDSLAFNDNFFNKIFSIAVFHHFPPTIASFWAKELKRVLKCGGTMIITVWNLEQEGYFIPDKKNNRKVFYIPFKDNQGNVFKRYHYVYSLEELSKIFFDCGFGIKEKFIHNEKNLILIVQKRR